MFDHHLVKNVAPGSACIYCNDTLQGEWQSDFSGVKHYKCTICSCGKENCVNVDFSGTGHDGWSELEKKVSQTGSVRVIKKNIRILKK